VIDVRWRRGEFRAAYDDSLVTVSELAHAHPFRDTVDPLAHAERLHDHGRLCWRLAKFDEARRALERAIELRTAALGADHEATLDSRERLAAVASYQLRDDAVEQFEDVIVAHEEAGRDVRAAVALRNLAACQRDRGRVGAARAAIDVALATLAERLSDEHPDVVDARKVHALVLVREQQWWPARRAAEDAMALAKRAWDVDHPHVAGAELTLASAELQQRDFRAAREHLEHAAACFANAYGDTHPLHGIALSRRAQVERWDGELELAEAYGRRAVAAYRCTYRGPALVAIATPLVDTLIALGDLTAASAELAQLDAHASPEQRKHLATQLALALDLAGSGDAAAAWRARAELEQPV
jgi:tetratricopeptide (TPR) repeat protein